MVVDGLVASSGNAPVERLAFIFWSGDLISNIMPSRRGAGMTWLSLAQTYKGIVQFMEEFEWMAVKLTVLDDKEGPVGTGSLTYHRRPGGVGSNASSLVETS